MNTVVRIEQGVTRVVRSPSGVPPVVRLAPPEVRVVRTGVPVPATSEESSIDFDLLVATTLSI